MPISAAIFDCDGVLVDSMHVWATVTDVVLARHGATLEPGFFETIEPITLRNVCDALANDRHLVESADDLYEEMCEYLREQYATTGPMLEGCRAFLDELRAAGIPMIVATSTPVREASVALSAQGIDGYFVDIVSAEDTDCRDKEFPDVYLEAFRRLGEACGHELTKDEVWVFEDAPFAIRTARKAGFHVVGLINDHDGRRERDIRPHCDIFAHGYPELSLALINDYADPPMATHGMLEVLIVDGSPCQSSDKLVSALADEAGYVIAVDRGAEALRRIDVTPDVFCGDSDSVTPETACWARGHAWTTVAFPSEKYATDLAIALDCAEHEAARQACSLGVTVTCASGGRPDHAFAVVGLLANRAVSRARIVDDGFEMRVLRAGTSWELGECAAGKTFSVVAASEGCIASERGMRWELDHHPLALLDDVGISNVVTAPDAVVECHEGTLICWLFS